MSLDSEEIISHWIWVVMLSLAVVFSISAESIKEQNCLQQFARSVKPLGKVRVKFEDQSLLTGTLLKMQPDSLKLLISERRSLRITSVDFNTDHVIQLQTWKPGKPRILWGVIGFFAGQIIGQRIEGLVDPGSPSGWNILPFKKPMNNEDSTYFGAIGGTLAGIILSLIIPSVVSFRCN